MITPTTGRLVYYKSYGSPGGTYASEERAALITKVHTDTCVDLCVFNPTGLHFNQSVTQGSNPGQWDWMPYQREQAANAEASKQLLAPYFATLEASIPIIDETLRQNNAAEITFDEFVEYGKNNSGNIVNGMPWSFKYNGRPVTHENDECYLVGTLPLRFTPKDVLVTDADGALYLRSAE